MADDLSVKQNQPSATPWVLGTGLVGGAGTAYVANRYASAPYSSHEDLIKEENGKDAFNGKKVNGDAQTTAKEKAEATFKAAAEKYDADLKAYQEANKFGVQETPEFQELVKQQNELAEKVKGLEAQAGEAATATRTVTKTPLSAINKNADNLYRASEEYRALKEARASKEALAAAQAKVDKYTKYLNEAIEKTVANAKFEGTEAEIDAARKALKQELEAHVGMRQNARDVFNAKKPVNGIVNARASIAEQQKTIDEALKTIKETSGYDVKEALKSEKAFTRKMTTISNIQQNKIDVLQKMLDGYKNASEARTSSSFLDRLAWLFTGKEVPSGEDKKALEEFIKNLSDKEKKALQGKEISKETLEELLNAAKEKQATIEEATKNIRVGNTSIAYLEQGIKEKEAEVIAKYGKGTYINEAGEVCKGGKVIEKPAEFKGPEFKPAEAITAQRDRAIKNLEDRIAKLDPVKDSSEIAKLNDTINQTKAEYNKKIAIAETFSEKMPEKIELGTTNVLSDEAKELAKTKKQLEKVAAEVETARAGLPKTAERSAEELAAEFAKTNGTKKDAITKALKESEAELKPLFEKKWGKIAGVAAVGTAIAMGIGYLIAPKGDRA